MKKFDLVMNYILYNMVLNSFYQTHDSDSHSYNMVLNSFYQTHDSDSHSYNIVLLTDICICLCYLSLVQPNQKFSNLKTLG